MKAKDSGESRQRRIEIAAYHLAERRHFAPGHEVADWLAAEALVAREDAPTAGAPVATPKAPKAKPVRAAKSAVVKDEKPVDSAAPAPETKISKSKAKRPPATP